MKNNRPDYYGKARLDGKIDLLQELITEGGGDAWEVGILEMLINKHEQLVSIQRNFYDSRPYNAKPTQQESTPAAEPPEFYQWKHTSDLEKHIRWTMQAEKINYKVTMRPEDLDRLADYRDTIRNGPKGKTKEAFEAFQEIVLQTIKQNRDRPQDPEDLDEWLNKDENEVRPMDGIQNQPAPPTPPEVVKKNKHLTNSELNLLLHLSTKDRQTVAAINRAFPKLTKGSVQVYLGKLSKKGAAINTTKNTGKIAIWKCTDKGKAIIEEATTTQATIPMEN